MVVFDSAAVQGWRVGLEALAGLARVEIEEGSIAADWAFVGVGEVGEEAFEGRGGGSGFGCGCWCGCLREVW